MRTAACLALLLGLASPAAALAPGPDGWYHTGDGVRSKRVGLLTIRIYAASHYMRCAPTRSRRAVIEADCDKRMVWRMLRSIEGAQLQKGMREGYERNGYRDEGRLAQLFAAFGGPLREGEDVSFSYDAARQVTTARAPGGKSAQVRGVEFMRATWSVWFGAHDQPALGDALISRL